MPLAWFRLSCIALLATLAALQIGSAILETQTWDEAVHLAAGYSYLKTGDFRMNPEHPPLAKMLNALPLLFFNPRLPLDHPSWKGHQQIEFGGEFLYRNRVPADTILLAARSATVCLTLTLGVAIAFWTRRWFGPWPALFALFLFCLDPNIIAHGRYVTTDMAAALFIFLTCAQWIEFCRGERRRDLILTAIFLGLALVSKFSCAYLIALLPAIGLFARPFRPLHWLRALLATLGIAWIVVCLTYLGSPHPYLKGLSIVLKHNRGGHVSYLLGEISQTGRWDYFPVAFLVKSPMALLALLIPCGWWLARKWTFVATGLVLTALLYFGLAMLSGLNIGLRHILPIYPPLFVLVAAGLFAVPLSRFRCALLTLAIGLQIFECARIHPHYLAFFNLAAGGPENGPRYLLDSNIDWGQDLKKLRAWMRAHDVPHVCISYFGMADFNTYGVGNYPLPRTDEPEKRAALDCVAAASVTTLYGLYVPPGSYDWLRQLRPAAKIGYSIYVYDLRKNK